MGFYKVLGIFTGFYGEFFFFNLNILKSLLALF